MRVRVYAYTEETRAFLSHMLVCVCARAQTRTRQGAPLTERLRLVALPQPLLEYFYVLQGFFPAVRRHRGAQASRRTHGPVREEKRGAVRGTGEEGENVNERRANAGKQGSRDERAHDDTEAHGPEVSRRTPIPILCAFAALHPFCALIALRTGWRFPGVSLPRARPPACPLQTEQISHTCRLALAWTIPARTPQPTGQHMPALRRSPVSLRSSLSNTEAVSPVWRQVTNLGRWERVSGRTKNRAADMEEMHATDFGRCLCAPSPPAARGEHGQCGRIGSAESAWQTVLLGDGA